MAHKLKIEEILRLLQGAKDLGNLQWLSMAVAFNHGLRASEVVAITPTCITDGKLVMPRRKGSNEVCDKLVEHPNPLISERAALIELALKTRKNQSLFPITTRTFQRWVHKAGERAGLPELLCHPHTLKHSVLQFLRRNGMNLDQLKPRSGHKNVNSLDIYSGFEREETDAMVEAAFSQIPAF